MQWFRLPRNLHNRPLNQPNHQRLRREPEQSADPTADQSGQLADAAVDGQEQPEQSAETTAEEAPQREPDNPPVVPSDQPDPEGVKKESDSVKQEDDLTDDEITADDLVSLVATAGSAGGDTELAAHPRLTQGRRNNLARYVIGGLGLDSFIDIFNVLCASASRYVDSVGTFVRKLSLSESSPQVLQLIGEFDPVIVFVDSEIEEADSCTWQAICLYLAENTHLNKVVSTGSPFNIT